MYFTNPSSLNSMEAMMRATPHSRQRGGGRKRSQYKYTKEDCDYRLCLYYRKKAGGTAAVCPVWDIRLGRGAASTGEAVKAVFKDVKNAASQKRLSQIHNRKDDVSMIFQSSRHKQIFETERLNLRKPNKKVLAALYRLTADKALRQKTKTFLTGNGKVDLQRQSVHSGNISTDGYALWKAVKGLQTGERQISLCELSGSYVIDRVFRLIVQAVTIARFGSAVFNNTEVRYV